jgi:hypothetical protein
MQSSNENLIPQLPRPLTNTINNIYPSYQTGIAKLCFQQKKNSKKLTTTIIIIS